MRPAVPQPIRTTPMRPTAWRRFKRKALTATTVVIAGVIAFGIICGIAGFAIVEATLILAIVTAPFWIAGIALVWAAKIIAGH